MLRPALRGKVRTVNHSAPVESLISLFSETKTRPNSVVRDSDLLAHGLGVGDCCAEESVPLESAVQTGPVVVSVSGVRQAPRHQRVVLFVLGVALLPPALSAPTDASLCPSSLCPAGFLVVVGVAPE